MAVTEEDPAVIVLPCQHSFCKSCHKSKTRKVGDCSRCGAKEHNVVPNSQMNELAENYYMFKEPLIKRIAWMKKRIEKNFIVWDNILFMFIYYFNKNDIEEIIYCQRHDRRKPSEKWQYRLWDREPCSWRLQVKNDKKKAEQPKSARLSCETPRPPSSEFQICGSKKEEIKFARSPNPGDSARAKRWVRWRSSQKFQHFAFDLVYRSLSKNQWGHSIDQCNKLIVYPSDYLPHNANNFRLQKENNGI